MKSRSIIGALFLLFGAVLTTSLLAARSVPAASPELAAAGQTVTISNFQFAPKSVHVKVGSDVTWQVKEGTHTVTADNGAFSSQALSAGQKFSYTFTKPGTYRYYCSFHGSKGGHDMAGTAIVSR